MSVPGSYERQTSIPWRPDSENDHETSFIFHMDKEMCPELQVELEQTMSVLQVSICADCHKAYSPLLSRSTLQPMPFGPWKCP